MLAVRGYCRPLLAPRGGGMDANAEPWPFGSGSGYLHLQKANCAPNYNPPTERWQRWRRDSQKMGEKGEKEGQPPRAVRVLPGDSSAEAVLDALASDRAVVVRTRPQRGLLCEAAAAAALPGGQQAAHSAVLIGTLGPEQSAALLAEPLIMEVCDAVLASQALRMDADELARRVVGVCVCVCVCVCGCVCVCVALSPLSLFF